MNLTTNQNMHCKYGLCTVCGPMRLQGTVVEHNLMDGLCKLRNLNKVRARYRVKVAIVKNLEKNLDKAKKKN